MLPSADGYGGSAETILKVWPLISAIAPRPPAPGVAVRTVFSHRLPDGLIKSLPAPTGRRGAATALRAARSAKSVFAAVIALYAYSPKPFSDCTLTPRHDQPA